MCIAIFAVLIVGQVLTGWRDHDNDARAHHQRGIALSEYVTTGHFVEATFENWESEFLAVGAIVGLTIVLRQRGSSESKPVAAPNAQTGSGSRLRRVPRLQRRDGRYTSDVAASATPLFPRGAPRA